MATAIGNVSADGHEATPTDQTQASAPGESQSEATATDQTQGLSATESQPETALNTSAEAVEVSNTNQAYARLEPRLKAIVDIAGFLTLAVEGREPRTVPVSVLAGSSVDNVIQVSEFDGQYTLVLKIPGRDEPILKLVGKLGKVGDKTYTHSYGDSDANPNYFDMTDPEAVGADFTVGYVETNLRSCVLFAGDDTQGTMVLVLGADGNGNIEHDETMTKTVSVGDNCLNPIQSNYPLSSYFRATVTDAAGADMAINQGDYVLKGTVVSLTGQEEVSSSLVEEFNLSWKQVPYLATWSITNHSLSPVPMATTQVLAPGEKRTTVDSIGHEASEDDEQVQDPPSPVTSTEAGKGDGRTIIEILLDNWVFIAIGAAGVYVAYMVISAHRRPSRRNMKT